MYALCDEKCNQTGNEIHIEISEYPNLWGLFMDGTHVARTKRKSFV